jgi:hypothetical protein
VKIIIKFFGIVILLGIILFLGTCYFQNCRGTDTGGPVPPSADKAEYSLKVKNTGLTIYANKVLQMAISTSPDKKYITRQLYEYICPEGYWEAKTDKFIFKKPEPPLILDERIMGEIEVRKR